MQRLRHDADWIRWTSALMPAMVGLALAPCGAQAQAKATAQTPDRKPIPKEEASKTAPDKRTLQVGGYTLKLVDPDRPSGFQVGGQFGNQPFQSNVSFFLDISAANPDDVLLVDGVENLHGVDEQDRPVRGPAGNFFRPMAPRTDGVKRETIPLETKGGANSLKTLEGNLLLETGAVRTFTFTGDDLHFDASKKANEVAVTLDFFKQYSDNEVRIYLTCLYPRFNSPVDQQVPRRPMIWNQRVTVDLVGTDGVVYKNGSRGESSHEDRPRGLPVGGNNGVPLVSRVISHIDMSFQQLPEGVRIKSIVCRVIEQAGDTRSVPFKFMDVALPGKP